MKSRDEILRAIQEAAEHARRCVDKNPPGKRRFEVAIQLLDLYRTEIERNWPPTVEWMKSKGILGIFAMRQFDEDFEGMQEALVEIAYAVRKAAGL